jgi:hypothetical protein
MTDASDADRLEQQLEVEVPEGPVPRPALDPEAPEADAFEQALPAPFDEDEVR